VTANKLSPRLWRERTLIILAVNRKLPVFRYRIKANALLNFICKERSVKILSQSKYNKFFLIKDNHF